MISSRAKYGRIENVEGGSPASRSGIVAGDELVSIDSHRISDILDYAYHSGEQEMLLEIKRGEDILTFTIRKGEDESVGIEFDEELFDGCRSCANNCIFCFLKQMPKGMRESLYVRDDDYRLSFAQGNYITLTNLSETDMQKILTQRMGPLYISVQATEPGLRTRMLRNPNAGAIMGQLRALAGTRISMHTQIVLCPGINDGSHLDQSIHDLASLHPWVESIAVVPVGLTRHRKGLDELRPFTSSEARDVVQSMTRWQKEFRKALGTRLVYASDEFYILAGIEFPRRAAYEGFPQYENGVGISRLFLDELRRAAKRLTKMEPKSGRYVLVTGVLASDMVSRFANLMRFGGKVNARACIVKNKFFGETVTVAGLLTGEDIAEALKDSDNEETILVPDVALNDDRFLDDVTVSDLSRITGRRVVPVQASPLDLIKQLEKS